jgi:hypothetical protein
VVFLRSDQLISPLIRRSARRSYGAFFARYGSNNEKKF